VILERNHIKRTLVFQVDQVRCVQAQLDAFLLRQPLASVTLLRLFPVHYVGQNFISQIKRKALNNYKLGSVFQTERRQRIHDLIKQYVKIL
jgi:hypothetical protein